MPDTTVDASKVNIDSVFSIDDKQAPSEEHVLFVFKVANGKPVHGSQGYYTISELLAALGQDAADAESAAIAAKEEAVAAKEYIEENLGNMIYQLPAPQVEFVLDPDGDRGVIKLLAGYDELGTVQVKLVYSISSDMSTVFEDMKADVQNNGTYHVTAVQQDEDYPLGSSLSVPITVSSLKTQKPAAVYSAAAARSISVPSDIFAGIFAASLRPSKEGGSFSVFACTYENGQYSLSSNMQLNQKKLYPVFEPNHFAFNSFDETVYTMILAAVHGSDRFLVLVNRGIKTSSLDIQYYPPITIPDMLLTESQIDFAVMISSSPMDGDLYEFVTLPSGVSKISVNVPDSIKTTAASGETVELIALSEDAQINYAIDDPDAWRTGTQSYSSPIAVSASKMLITATSLKGGIAVSDVLVFPVGYDVDAPELSMQSGTASDSCKILVSNSSEYDSDVTLHYTDDGSEPTEESTEVSDEGIVVSRNCTIRVKAIGTYKSNESSITVSSLKVQKPTITVE